MRRRDFLPSASGNDGFIVEDGEAFWKGGDLGEPAADTENFEVVFVVWVVCVEFGFVEGESSFREFSDELGGNAVFELVVVEVFLDGALGLDLIVFFAFLGVSGNVVAEGGLAADAVWLDLLISLLICDRI